MKRLLTFACIALLSHLSFGQGSKTFIKVRNSTWEKPTFEPTEVKAKNIKSIQIKTLQQGHKLQMGKNLSYRFDDQGHLLQFVERKNQDTSYVEAISYTESGVVKSKQIENKSWNRTYREGFRHNSNSTVFQAKSYEVVNPAEDEVVLLHTKQYVYLDGKDSLLQAIRYLENREIVKQEQFAYDKADRLVEELTLSSQEDTLKHISYTYDNQDLLTRIVTREGVNIKESSYTYNENGNPTRVQWLENGQVKGTILYTYDEEGKLKEMKQMIDERKAAGTVHIFEYEKH